MIRIFCGNVGCLIGSTKINLNRGGNGKTYNLEHIYNMFTKSQTNKGKLWNLDIPTMTRSYNGETIQLHKIKDVIFSGKQKVFTINLKSGRNLTGTENHLIMTSEGWTPLKQCLNKNIMIDQPHAQKSKEKTHKLPNASITATYHPYKSKNGVEVHRLIYEAHQNNISFKDFLRIIWNYEEQAKNMYYVNPKFYIIHHKDGNHYNNDINNLELLTKEEHLRIHSYINKNNFYQGIPSYEKCTSITAHEKEQKTYDIICEEPHHNFCANGIIVHNSGKTLSAVREMHQNLTKIPYYTNIQTKLKHCHLLKPEMIATKTLVETKRTGRKIYEYEVNTEFWKKIPKPINIVLDESHNLINSRKSMSNQNIVIMDWLKLIRKILGESPTQQGDLTFITQLINSIDTNSRQMATQIRHHISHYRKTCLKCHATFAENSEYPEPLKICPMCKHHHLQKHSHKIEVKHFANLEAYDAWKIFGSKTWHKHYILTDIEKYFTAYDSYQLDNLLDRL